MLDLTNALMNLKVAPTLLQRPELSNAISKNANTPDYDNVTGAHGLCYLQPIIA